MIRSSARTASLAGETVRSGSEPAPPHPFPDMKQPTARNAMQMVACSAFIARLRIAVASADKLSFRVRYRRMGMDTAMSGSGPAA